MTGLPNYEYTYLHNRRLSSAAGPWAECLHCTIAVVSARNWLQSWYDRQVRPTKTSTNPDGWALCVWPSDRIRIDHDSVAFRHDGWLRNIGHWNYSIRHFLLRTANIRHRVLLDWTGRPYVCNYSFVVVTSKTSSDKLLIQHHCRSYNMFISFHYVNRSHTKTCFWDFELDQIQ